MIDESAPGDPLTALEIMLPLAIRVALTLGLFDMMRRGPTSVEELARGSGATVDGLRRLLRYLALKGWVEITEPDHYTLAPPSFQVVEMEGAESFRRMLDLDGAGGRLTVTVLTQLLHSVRTGEPGWPVWHGRAFYEDYNVNPDLASDFASLMTPPPEFVYRDLDDAFPWHKVARVVDVGGGTGGLLRSLLSRFGHLSGILVDLPRAVVKARETLADAGLAERSTCIARSFFAPLPIGGDVYLLYMVLGDWGDRDACKILRRCAQAAGHGGRILIREGLRMEDPTDVSSAESDLIQLVATGGKRRSRGDFEALIQKSDLGLVSCETLPSGKYLFQCEPVFG